MKLVHGAAVEQVGCRQLAAPQLGCCRIKPPRPQGTQGPGGDVERDYGEGELLIRAAVTMTQAGNSTTSSV